MIILLLAAGLSLLFFRSFQPDYVHFSNDGPLGEQKTYCEQLPDAFFGGWSDLNCIGFNGGAWSPNFTTLFSWALGPVGVSKFFAPISLLILGTGAWCFFRQLKLTPLAALLGTIAVTLNSTFFASACWGVAPQEVALGMIFFALSLVVANTVETPWHIRWTRLALAGFCVGVNVMEAADIGALFSLFLAAFVLYKAWMDSRGGYYLKRVAYGTTQVLVIAIFAGFLAYQTVIGLVGSSIQGTAGTAQDRETKAQHWDWATQWSLPKKETLGLMIPGLFGYKMDTPKDMIPAVQDTYRGGAYWGGVGRDPMLDRFFDNGSQGTPPPSNFMRFTGGGNYCGILVVLVGIWAIAQAFRRQHSLFSETERHHVWFWTFVAIVCLPLAWGRFAPGSHQSSDFLFYALLYKLPYFSTIRNPVKFLIFFSWAISILFAYGIHLLDRRYFNRIASKPTGLTLQVKNWWAKAEIFDRNWVKISGGLLGVVILGWLAYSAQKPNLVQYLEKMGFPDETMAGEIATFSINQAGLFLILFAAALFLIILTLAGYFSGTRVKVGAWLLGIFLVFDLVRADLPYVIHWNYKQKYEVNSLNPVVDFLAKNPYEHRVAGLPFRAPAGLEWFDQVYRIEWMQHLFLYYNIQCLDLIQAARIASDLKTYLETFTPSSNETIGLFARQWQLTNTRYLLGPAGFLPVLNQQLDPERHRFRILQRFSIAPKPGIVHPSQLEELTAYPNDNGDYALFDFTGALPRAKLYSNWQVNTNDAANLKTLADLKFDPLETVLISTPQKNLPASITNTDTGTVTYTSYTSKHSVFATSAAAPTVLLFNDKYDPNWRVTVDGQPAELLRCNFIMRGVYLPPGPHTVKFDFSLPNKPLYVTVAAISTALILSGLLYLLTRCRPAAKV